MRPLFWQTENAASTNTPLERYARRLESRPEEWRKGVLWAGIGLALLVSAAIFFTVVFHVWRSEAALLAGFPALVGGLLLTRVFGLLGLYRRSRSWQQDRDALRRGAFVDVDAKVEYFRAPGVPLDRRPCVYEVVVTTHDGRRVEIPEASRSDVELLVSQLDPALRGDWAARTASYGDGLARDVTLARTVIKSARWCAYVVAAFVVTGAFLGAVGYF